MQQPEPKIALLIDADNVPASKIRIVLSEVEKYGVVTVRRAYGNWSKESLKPWVNCLPAYAICPMQQFDYTKGKNASDVALAIDAMELLFTQPIDAFAIVSSDSDFTPLVVRILNNNKKVYGFGERKAPSPFVSACSAFFYLEAAKETAKAIAKAEVGDSLQERLSQRKAEKSLKHDTKLIQILRGAIANVQETDGWAAMSQVGMQVKKQPEFSLSHYGYKSIGRLFKAIDLFETRQQQAGLYVRQKGR